VIRRSLLAMFAAAPAAAVVSSAPPSAPPPAWGKFAPTAPYDAYGLEPAIMSQNDDGPLEYAKKRLAALQWAERNGISEERLDPFGVIDAEANAMRSWSPAHRERWRMKRIEQMRHASRYREAVEHVERQIKLSLAPEWVRRFL
jgi:hypothetical protein